MVADRGRHAGRDKGPAQISQIFDTVNMSTGARTRPSRRRDTWTTWASHAPAKTEDTPGLTHGGIQRLHLHFWKQQVHSPPHAKE